MLHVWLMLSQNEAFCSHSAFFNPLKWICEATLKRFFCLSSTVFSPLTLCHKVCQVLKLKSTRYSKPAACVALICKLMFYSFEDTNDNYKLLQIGSHKTWVRPVVECKLTEVLHLLQIWAWVFYIDRSGQVTAALHGEPPNWIGYHSHLIWSLTRTTHNKTPPCVTLPCQTRPYSVQPITVCH